MLCRRAMWTAISAGAGTQEPMAGEGRMHVLPGTKSQYTTSAGVGIFRNWFDELIGDSGNVHAKRSNVDDVDSRPGDMRSLPAGDG